jgi:hypothetical protein
MWKHSFGACRDNKDALVPEAYIAAQLNTILHGLKKT